MAHLLSGVGFFIARPVNFAHNPAMMKRYTVATDFQHGTHSYSEGEAVDFHESTGDALKANGLIIDYKPPGFPQPVREQSASRPGRVSRKQTSS